MGSATFSDKKLRNKLRLEKLGNPYGFLFLDRVPSGRSKISAAA